jgi:hypothetical protein
MRSRQGRQAGVRDLISTLRRLDPTGARAVRRALHIAGGIHRLRVAHLIVGLLALDGRLLMCKLRSPRIDRAHLVGHIYAAAAAKSGGDLAASVRILQLAGMLAPPGARINTQHLCAAILLMDGNPIAAYLRDANIDRQPFVRQRFAHLFAVDEAVRALAREAEAGGVPDTPGTASSAVLQAWAGLRDRQPPVPRSPQGEEVWSSEDAARRWLRKLIPQQADRYAAEGCIEIDSTLVPGRRYRIHRSRLTDVCQRGTPRRRSCLRLSDGALPPTDRVLAEYFLIQGDESSYLKTANIKRW